MKQIFLTLLMLGFVFSVSAQSGSNTTTKRMKTPEERATAHAAELKKDLGLTEDQYTKVYNAKFDKLSAKQAILEKYNNDKKKARPELKVIHDKFVTAMKGILTPEQYATWSARKDKDGKPLMEDND